MDVDRNGTLDAEDFLNGCLRVRGAAKSLDLLLMMRENQRMYDMFRSTQTEVREMFGILLLEGDIAMTNLEIMKTLK